MSINLKVSTLEKALLKVISSPFLNIFKPRDKQTSLFLYIFFQCWKDKNLKVKRDLKGNASHPSPGPWISSVRVRQMLVTSSLEQ